MRHVAGDQKIAVVMGTRPEIIKLAPIVRMLGHQAALLHSGQHRDDDLSGVFLSAAELPEPELLHDICGQARYAQLGRMIEQFGGQFARLKAGRRRGAG